MKESTRRGLKIAAGAAAVLPVVAATPVGAQDADHLSAEKAPTYLAVTDVDGSQTRDVTNSTDSTVRAARQQMLQKSSVAGEVLSLKDVRATRTAGGSIVVSTSGTQVLESAEESWVLDGNIVAEQIAIRTVDGPTEAARGGGLGFSVTVMRDRCNNGTRTPAGNIIESCFKKVKSTDGDASKDYWGYHRRATANPVASSQNSRFYVKKIYADSVEAAGPAGNMARSSELSPLPGDVITNGCSTINVGLSLPGGMSAGFAPEMCSSTKTIDAAGWGEATRYGITYDFGAKSLDRGKPHSVAFAMGASISEGMTPSWYDYTQACFDDNFGVYGCSIAQEPA